MNYQKPEIVALGSASESVQNNNMKGKSVVEKSYPYELTNGAYQETNSDRRTLFVELCGFRVPLVDFL